MEMRIFKTPTAKLTHASFVGLITAIVIVICQITEWKAWIVFLPWALYFLHGCTVKNGIRMFFALLIGIAVAKVGTYAIDHLNIDFDKQWWVIPLVIFFVATLLVFLEFTQKWCTFVPASFLGTVVLFADGVPLLRDLVPEIVIPLLFGVLVGWVTVEGRGIINKKLPT